MRSIELSVLPSLVTHHMSLCKGIILTESLLPLAREIISKTFMVPSSSENQVFLIRRRLNFLQFYNTIVWSAIYDKLQIKIEPELLPFDPTFYVPVLNCLASHFPVVSNKVLLPCCTTESLKPDLNHTITDLIAWWFEANHTVSIYHTMFAIPR